MRGVVRLSRNHGNILRSDCAFECLVVPKLIPSCTIGKADGGVFSSSYFIANVMEIGARVVAFPSARCAIAS